MAIAINAAEPHRFVFESDKEKPEEEQRSLKVPMIFLSLSILALLLSFLYYCKRAGYFNLPA